jgi:hypothetical protein
VFAQLALLITIIGIINALIYVALSGSFTNILNYALAHLKSLPFWRALLSTSRPLPPNDPMHIEIRNSKPDAARLSQLRKESIA